jgi:hypothetical protein
MITVSVMTSNSSWEVDIESRKDIGRIFQNPDVEKVYVPQKGEDEPEILTRWEVYQSYHDGERWRLTSLLNPEFYVEKLGG